MKRAAIALLLALGCRRAEEAEPPVKPVVTVKVAKAELGDVDQSLEAPATIFPRERASISSSLTAPIRALRARKGDTVKKDQVLAVLEDRDLRAQRAEAAAALRQAEVLKARRQELFAQGAIPHRELLAAETDLLQSKARLEKIDAQLRFTELRSPFAGTIVEQQLYAGDMVKPDTPVFTVVDIAVAVARAQVPEAEIAAVKKGQTATFTSEQGSASGRITMINQAVDPQRRTVEVWCEIPNAQGALRDGAFGHLSIVTEARPKRVVVPRAAVQAGEEGTGTVMVVTEEKNVKTAHKREVKTGGGAGDRVAIAQGLKAGEVVVVEGGYGLPDGAEVKLPGGDEHGGDDKGGEKN